jgi:hypothetical protein
MYDIVIIYHTGGKANSALGVKLIT